MQLELFAQAPLPAPLGVGVKGTADAVKALLADNAKRLKNAVAVSMVERQCSEAQAVLVVKNAAIAAERRFLDRKRDLVEAMREQHSEVVMFLDAVEHFAAGNSLWCSSCPLYHRRR